MKKLLTLLIFVIASITMLAGERSEQQMRDAALKVLNQNATRRSAGSELKEFMAMPKLSIYGYDEGGFAVIAKDDKYAEYLGSSVTKFSEAMPCGFKWWLEATNEAMENNVEPTPASSRAMTTARRAGVSPLITTKWGQIKPYNNKCKVTCNGKDYYMVTGCVATAMAQVMNYYKYPAKGMSEHSYTINYSDLGSITYYSNFENSYYDWNNMLDDYSNYQYSENQYTDAVAKLMSDCGIAVEMKYTTYSSGAYSSDVPNAMNKFFSYSFLDETNKIYNRTDWSNDEWISLVYNALINNHPILYYGYTERSGHAFIIHGYNNDGSVYVNWGWNGAYDGYFMIDMLNPTTKDSYNNNQQMIIPIPEGQAIVTNTYKLTYIVDGTMYKEYELKSGETITPEPAPSKAGYTFSGWSSIPQTMPAKDVTVTGSFSKGSYKLIYKVDGTIYKTQNYNYGATIIPEAAPTKDGYTFSGWSNVPSSMPAYDVTVTGSFTINKYKLTYVVVGETYKSYELEYGAPITPESEPTKDGYTFTGWTGIPTTMPSHNVTVTGEFRENSPSANTVTTEIDGIYYILIGSAGTAEVTSSPNRCSGSITIPESVEYEGFTYKVTQIGEKAFDGCYNLSSVSIPSSVTKIGEYNQEIKGETNVEIIPVIA